MRKIFLIFNTIYLQCFNVLQLQKKARLLNQLVKESRLRKLGDSNPRYGYPYGSLANCWFQPLTQTSKCSAYGNRTRVSAVRGPRPGPLDESAISVETKSGSWGIRTPGTVTRTAV